MTSPLTSHVLDTALGLPAAHMRVRLAVEEAGAFHELVVRETNPEGRVLDLLELGQLQTRTYRLRFDTAGYFIQTRRPCFYPWIDVVFQIVSPAEHYHVPLLVSPYGYSTYRGS